MRALNHSGNSRQMSLPKTEGRGHDVFLADAKHGLPFQRVPAYYPPSYNSIQPLGIRPGNPQAVIPESLSLGAIIVLPW